MIRDNGWKEIYVSNVGVAWWNPQILMAYPQSIAPQFSVIDASLSILLPKISLIQPQFSILKSSSWDTWLKKSSSLLDFQQNVRKCRYYRYQLFPGLNYGIPKKLWNFAHRPKRGGVSCTTNFFIKVKYGHVPKFVWGCRSLNPVYTSKILMST